MNKLWLFIVILFLHGCTYTEHTKISSNSYSQYDGELIISTKDIDQPYEEIAIIHSSGKDIDYRKNKIVSRARELGANAIIRFNCGEVYTVTTGAEPIIGTYPKCTALAVRINNN